MTMPSTRPYAHPLPDWGCDCHVHVFGPFDRFPLWAQRAYTPGPASIEDLTALHEFMVREINKGNAEITSAHKQAHFHIVEGLKSIGKTIGL